MRYTEPLHTLAPTKQKDLLKWRNHTRTRFVSEDQAYAAGKLLARSPAEREAKVPHATVQDLKNLLIQAGRPATDEAIQAELTLDSPEDPVETAPPETMSRTTLDKLTLPPYNAKDPKLWFKQAEDAFALVRTPEGQPIITDPKTKLTLVGKAIPPELMTAHKAFYLADDYEGFQNALCGVAVKTDAAIYLEFTQAALNDMLPSQFVQNQMVLLGYLDDNATDTKANLTEWLLKSSLELQMPPALRAAMAGIKFDTKNYLNRADTLHVNHKAGTAAAGTASMERMVAALEKEGADSDQIAAFRQTASRGRNGNGKGKPPNKNRSPPQKCRPHAQYGDKAWHCGKGDCPDRNKPLAPRPENRSKKGETAPIEDDEFNQ